MLKLWIAGWLLSGLYCILGATMHKIEEEDILMSLFVALVPSIGAYVNIYCILDLLSESSYKDYMREAGIYRSSSIYLTFKQVKQFYIVNPTRWELYSNVLLYNADDFTRFIVLFRNPIDYYRTMRFFNNGTTKSKAAQISKEDQNMKKFLEYMRKDIDALNAQAEKELNEAKEQLNTIRWV